MYPFWAFETHLTPWKNSQINDNFTNFEKKK